MVTLTGTFTRLDGDPATGTVRVTPSRSPIMDSAGQVVISGPQTFPLDGAGKLAVEMPASNDPDLGPAFTYTVEALLSHKPWKISKVWIPHGSTTVDLSEIGDYQPVPGVATRVVTIPADGEDGQVLVWDGAGFSWEFPPEGPEGPPGEVTTAALTTALAGKVTGTGMTVRRHTGAGERILLDHPGGTTMIFGDTGWRVLTSWDAEGTVTGTPLQAGMEPIAGEPGEIAIRRRGPEIMLNLYRARITNSTAISIPVGFRPGGPSEYVNLPRVPYNGTVMLQGRAGSASFFIQASTYPTNGEASYRAMFRFLTSAAWPEYLPGTPA